MSRILVLCHGNINRSPLAAAVLRTYPGLEVKEAALKSWNNRAWKPERASRKMRDAALELGFNLEEHRSTAIYPALYGWADTVVYMDGGNLKRLDAFLEQHGFAGKCVCLGHYGTPPVSRIPDPAFIKRGTQEFHDVVQLIVSCSHGLGKKLIADRASKRQDG